MRRRALYKTKASNNFNWSFDTKSDTPTDKAFTIRRLSDSVEQDFTFAEVIDGTYETFISGTQGAIKSWYNGAFKLEQTTNIAHQPLLVVNAGSPYVDDKDQVSGVEGYNIPTSFSNDWVITAIFGKENNNNNQRLTYGICGDILHENFRFDIKWDGTLCPQTNVNTEVSTPPVGYSNANSDSFNVYAFSNIGGVFKVYKNDVEITSTVTPSWSVKDNEIDILNSIRIGHPNAGATVGKINKHQHLGIVYDTDLSGFDLSAHNQAIMTKYGI
jgi:hypothetical protein